MTVLHRWHVITRTANRNGERCGKSTVADLSCSFLTPWPTEVSWQCQYTIFSLLTILHLKYPHLSSYHPVQLQGDISRRQGRDKVPGVTLEETGYILVNGNTPIPQPAHWSPCAGFSEGPHFEPRLPAWITHSLQHPLLASFLTSFSPIPHLANLGSFK